MDASTWFLGGATPRSWKDPRFAFCRGVNVRCDRFGVAHRSLGIDAIRSPRATSQSHRHSALNAGSCMQRPLGMLVCALLLIPGTVAAQTKLEDNVDGGAAVL